jgi:pyrroline-5-carboxylate reductase
MSRAPPTLSPMHREYHYHVVMVIPFGQIREGMTVLTILPPSDSEGPNKSILLQIFSSIGRCRFLEERHFDACTALSGAGPAFACIFLEAMADGGVMMGLPRAEALELAAQCTCAGC